VVEWAPGWKIHKSTTLKCNPAQKQPVHTRTLLQLTYMRIPLYDTAYVTTAAKSTLEYHVMSPKHFTTCMSTTSHFRTCKLVRRLPEENEMICMCPQAHEHRLLPSAPLDKNKRRLITANTPFCYLDKHHSPAVYLDQNTMSDHPYSILRLAWSPVECGKAPSSHVWRLRRKRSCWLPLTRKRAPNHDVIYSNGRTRYRGQWVKTVGFVTSDWTV
jgi:hypothetical protein